jgi:hypothetical protein
MEPVDVVEKLLIATVPFGTTEIALQTLAIGKEWTSNAEAGKGSTAREQ